MIKNIFRTIKLTKLSIKNATVELSKNDDQSVFNRNLDEILYFFEVNPYQIVFIEDLDRFNNIKIFMKLRELNMLINNSEQINRRVVFIYAIKDEMFSNKDRTKFFDFIIPVIPVVNSTNSGEILWQELDKHNLTEGLTESFVNDICLYIDDMRILNNIFNEYIIYRKKLMNGETAFLNPLKLFSIIVYKNIDPDDFAKLQYSDGIVYDVFQEKQKIIEEKIADVQSEIEELEEQLILSENEHLQSEKELRTLYWYEAVGNNHAVSAIILNSQEYSITEFIEGNIDLSTIEGIFDGIYTNRYGKSSIQLSIDKKISTRLLKRLENIRNKSIENKKNINGKIDNLKLLISEIKSWSLEKVMQEIGVDKFFPTRNSKNGLIVFLLRNGYIDEFYPHYINNFYDGSLKHFDMIFLLKVKDQIALDFDHLLTNPSKIMTRLNFADFSRREVLNFQLVNYLLGNCEHYNEQFSILMNQLSNEDEHSVKFIDSYLQYSLDQSKFITELSHQWHNIWNYISGSSIISEKRKQDYFGLILFNATIDDIRQINSEGKLTETISTMPLFLEFVPNEHLSKIKKVIAELKIKFLNLSLTDNFNNDLLEFIIENNYYELNLGMVQLVVCYKYNGDGKGNLERSNLTTIKSLNYEPLWNYLQDNISSYIENVIFSLSENSNESEEVVIELMNLDEEILSIEVKEKFILMQLVKIADINTIPEYLWGYVVKNNKIKCSWENVLQVYLQDNIINQQLIIFLNIKDNYEILSQTKLNAYSHYDEDVYKQLSRALIYCKELTTETFKSLQKSIPYRYNRLSIELLSAGRLHDLIDYGLLNFTKENYDDIRENHKIVLHEFISKHLSSFLSNDFEVDNDDCLNLISSDKISIDNKVKIMNMFGDILECTGISHANKLLNVIFNFKPPFQISAKILTSILAQNISMKNKLELLLNQQEFLDYSKMKLYMDLIGEPYSRMFVTKNKPVVDDTKTNRQIIQLLNQHDLISSFKEETNGKIRVVAKY